MSEYCAGCKARQDEIERLRKALESARMPHLICSGEGCCDTDVGEKCNCGADQHNAIIDAVLGRFVVYDEQAFRERYGDGIRLLADPEPEQPASEPEAQREPCGMTSGGTEVSQLRERITELETERDKMLGDINVQAFKHAMEMGRMADALIKATKD